MTVTHYDPRDVRVTFNGVEMKGFLDGTLIEVERPSLWSPWSKKGACGDVTLTLTHEGEGRDLLREIARMPAPPEVLQQRYAWLKQLRLIFRDSRRRRRMELRRRRGRGACSS